MESIPTCGCGCGSPLLRTGQRFISGHNRRKSPIDYLVEDRGYATSCWVWQKSLNKKGYGLAKDGTAHRRYYQMFKGPIPNGLQLDHLCRVRHCVNPDHLEAVTPVVNNHRGVCPKISAADALAIFEARTVPLHELAERYGITTTRVSQIQRGKAWTSVTHASADLALQPYKTARGARVSSTKLTPADVQEIRARYALAPVSSTTLAKDFHVTEQTIRHITSGKGWAHLEGASTTKPAWKKEQQSRIHPDLLAHGEQVKSSVLTESQVREIRARYAAGGIGTPKLGKEYGVAARTIYNVIAHRTWQHIE